jgi:predicted metalloprotease with PDZ domain
MADESAMSPAGRARLRTKPAAPSVRYTVSMPDPASHTFHVEIAVPADCVLAFPAWTPGSYKIREFGKNVSAFTAHGGRFELLDKQRYRVTGAHAVSFDLYADELSVRTPHLDDTHGFFLGTNLLPYVEGPDGLPVKLRHEVSIAPPDGWRVATSLPRLAGKASTWATDDYDILGDSPFEIGTHEVRSFKVRGVKHDIAFYGYGNFDAGRIVRDTAKIVEAQAKNFGGLPYKYYLFIHHITPDSGGGLEHLFSCVCGWNSWKFANEPDYQKFMRLVSHEFFHVWNVKRIRPRVLGPFDYRSEQYTKALWIMEGLTQYYERIWCSRAGVAKPQDVLDSFAETIEREDNRPGRRVMSLEQSSWLAWTKLYMADENYLNTGVSYYARGAQVGLLLDARIRAATSGRRSLDDVMRLAYRRYGWPKPGFEEGEYERLCEEVAGTRLTRFWRDHVKGTRELDYTEFLEVYGLEFSRDKQGNVPWLGFTAATKSGALHVTTVHADGPGRTAGLQPRDEILALNGHKVEEKSLEDRIKELKPGSTCTITLFRRDRLVEAVVKVARQPAGKLQLKAAAKPSAAQKRNLKKWLGSPSRPGPKTGSSRAATA